MKKRGEIFIQLNSNKEKMGLHNYIEQNNFLFIEPKCKNESSIIKDYSWIRRGSSIINSFIGNDVFIGFRCVINNCHIEEGCQIASRVEITESTDKTFIEKFSWIGAQVTIKGGIQIGEGAVVGARSFVLENVPPYSIVVGNPAKVIKKRDVIRDFNPNFRSFLTAYKKRFINQLNEKLEGKESIVPEPNFIDASLYQEEQAEFGKGIIAVGKKIIDVNGKKITDGGLFIGKNVKIDDNCILEAAGQIKIGSNTIIGKNVHIVSTGHDYRFTSLPMNFSPVHIGEDVQIEENVLILGGVTIADGIHIPSNTLVLHDVLQ